MHLLAIHAHPDDVEILAAGTLALLADRGHRITIVTMTAGDCGSKQYGPSELARLRQEEAARAASMIGADYRYAGFFDMSVYIDDPSRRRVTEILRLVRPDIILTSSPDDYHCDHEATSALVRDAAFAAPIPNYTTGQAPPLSEIPHLYFMDPDEGVDRQGRLVQPDFVVDVSTVMDRKSAMLACHDTQREWLREHHHMDNYIDQMREWTEARGRLAGIANGEGFRAYHRHPYPRTPALQELLAGFIFNAR